MAQTDWVVYGSPLWHKDTVQENVKDLPGPKELITLENKFVNDAIRTTVYYYPRKKPIIPVYSARQDKCAKAYFQSPLVKSLLKRERMSDDEMKTREMLKEEKNINKLSHRNRIQRTPSIQDIRARETKFTNDAIVTEKRRTRFKDIIPQYDASSDRHCKAYFKRKDVQQLLNVTRSAEENKMENYWNRKMTIAKRYSLFGRENALPQPEV
ncbi:uncharacterized protein LOC132720110 isoform X3 [Ruditapes philippinarum]|uniref:uncharacterized protein LOC132720110 isoform X3 n=1 Tax=Ruditapes philippinarum TaxID=129788 RepID=UPI00295B269A|nr:uncharacterized protein LOC132720110 isoform X3 [Ruditapes philippinarum]